MALGSRLSYEVLSFLSRVEKQGARAFDPNVLDRLRRAARSAWDGAYVAISAPVASDTWEIRTPLDTADTQAAGRVRFDRPIRITAMLPIVTLTAPAGALVVPTLDDLEASLVVDGERNFTQGTQDTVGGGPRDFVTLSGLSSAYPGPGRMFGRKLLSPTPVLTFTVRGKRGVGVYAPCDVRLVIFSDYLEPEPG